MKGEWVGREQCTWEGEKEAGRQAVKFHYIIW